MATLLRALIPEERGFFQEETQVVRNSSIAIATHVRLTRDVRIATLFLEVIKETCQAIIDRQYKNFDPLVRNFGCEISVVKIIFCMQDYHKLKEEAETLYRQKDSLQKEIFSIKGQPQKLPIGTSSLETIFQTMANTQVSEEFATLMRFRMLTIIHGKKYLEGSEISFTSILELHRRFAKNNDRADRTFLERYICTLQAEESMRAVHFVRRLAQTDMLREGLSITHSTILREGYPPIYITPLLCNMEISLQTIQTIMIRAKTTIAERPIPNAMPFVQYRRLLPQEREITPQEISNEEPIMVCEGYVYNKQALQQAIITHGIVHLMLIQSSHPHMQYGTNINKPLPTNNWEEKRAALFLQQSESRHYFELFHIYTLSGEEAKALS